MTTGERTPADARVILLAIGLGVAAVLVGLAPWLLTGARLPLQNLWAAPVVEADGVTAAPESMPVSLLPFSQYALTLQASLLITGSAVAGLVARAAGARRSRGAVIAVLAGTVGAQSVALVQSSVTVTGGLADRVESVVYLGAVVGAAVAGIAFGVVVLLLIARARRGAAVVGLAVGAIALAQWGYALVYPPFSLVTENVAVADSVLRWLPAVLVAAAIVWTGVSTIGRAIGATVALLGLWIGPAAITAISSVAGSRVYASYPFEMVEIAGSIFTSALASPATWRAVVVAAVLAGIGLAVRRPVLERRRRHGERVAPSTS
ncbi:hypothetical protein ASF17_00565 [Frigoribacterium sp. Leaf263]|uniref:hypothetical protein n=1 Tax=Frigoribacterium sp. Leaf263 TaxID=1736313 RepID=UPI0006F2C340|nr:hypothetical protein [Frigoribacterium sp. Leaf263]KQO84089.1 hypothetical protein ASF17_00565 [Frigoribacterium sp. Leaf263]